MERWRAAIVMYSAAVSVKMNVLLMAPSVLIVLLKVCPSIHPIACRNGDPSTWKP